jgi:hypothetical protein
MNPSVLSLRIVEAKASAQQSAVPLLGNLERRAERFRPRPCSIVSSLPDLLATANLHAVPALPSYGTATGSGTIGKPASSIWQWVRPPSQGLLLLRAGGSVDAYGVTPEGANTIKSQALASGDRQAMRRFRAYTKGSILDLHRDGRRRVGTPGVRRRAQCHLCRSSIVDEAIERTHIGEDYFGDGRAKKAADPRRAKLPV